MNLYKKIKNIARLLLVTEIFVGVISAIYHVKQQYSGSILLFSLIMCFVIFPQFMLLFLLEKFYEYQKKNIKIIADSVKNVDNNKFYELKEDKEYDEMFTAIESIRHTICETIDNNKMMTEILISATVNLELDKFLENVMPKIMNVVGGNWIVFYIVNKTTNKLEIKSSIGFSKSIYSQFDISIGEGFVGESAAENKIKIIQDIPDDSIYVSKTFIGKVKPKNIIVVPVDDSNNDNEVLGVIGIASMHSYTSKHIEIIEEIKKYVAFAVINGIYFNKNQRLTNELKFQNQLIQNLNEDLENKIRERTIFLNSILNSINDYAIISVDTNNQITLFNNGSERIFKIRKEEAIGKDIQIIADNVTSVEEKFIECIRKASRSGKYIEVCDIKRKDGTSYSAHIEFFTMYNEVQEISGITIVVRDTSYMKKLKTLANVERKMTEIMLEESVSALIIINEDFDIESLNKNAEYMIGKISENIEGRKIWDFFEEKEKVKMLIEQIKNEENKKSMSLKLANSDIKVSLKARLLLDEEEEIKKFFIYLH